MNDSRPLPIDHARLQPYLPTEPADSTVAAARAAMNRIDALAAQLGEQLDRLDSAEQVLLGGLVDAATGGDDLAMWVTKLDHGQRPILEHRLAQLGKARNVAAYRLGIAQSTDPAYLAWQRQCTEVRNQWQEVMYTAEGADIDRLRHLEAFAASH
jgi:hypothetical protein